MKKRETELDLLRLLAMLAVIFTHAGGVETTTVGQQSVMVFLLSTVTWHVPVFVMISGRFFLDPDRDGSGKKILSSILRLGIAFVFWDLVYQLHYLSSGAYAHLNWKGILSQALIGPYHFWYLHMLIWLYAITPFLRRIAADRKLTEYFLGLFFLFQFLTTYGPSLPGVGATVQTVAEKTNFHFALGYSGYFLLGFYLHRYPLSGKRELGLYVLGIGSLLCTGIASVVYTLQGAEGEEWFCKYLMPNVILEAAALYTFFVNRVRRIAFPPRFVRWVSSCAAGNFGVYLLHALVLEHLALPQWLLSGLHPLVSVCVTVLFTFALCCALSAIIRKIPRIGTCLS